MRQPALQFPSRIFPPTISSRVSRANSHQTWWGPIWRGLAAEPTGKHYRAMRSSLWLYVYLVIHADRRTGRLFRLLPTIAKDMGISLRTIRQWLATLRHCGYVTTEHTGRALRIKIEKWKPVKRTSSSPSDRQVPGL